jgi:uncharacterized protein YggU (UPF0235/DUF167 family)
MGERVAGPIRVRVRVKPRSARPLVGGRYAEDALLVAVREPAVDGRATEAALRAVADAFGVAPSRVRLVSGATSRTKMITVQGDPTELARRLDALLGPLE